MTEKQWADFLGINEECYKVIVENKKDNYSEFFNKFLGDKEDFIKYISGIDERTLLSYFFYLSFSIVANNDNIDIEKEGCNNIWLWADFVYHKRGFYGLETEFAIWNYFILSKKVQRLGRLEFELSKLKEDIKIGENSFPKGYPVINTHIPATGPLVYEECIDSYKKASKLFKTYLFDCESWLLAPCLEEMLPENSNINKFRKDYTLFEILENDRLFEERIFDGNIYDDPNIYVAKTSLQKKAKEKLLKGEKLPSAYGVFLFEEKDEK